MLQEAIYHKANSEYAYPISKKKFLVRLRTKKNDVNTVYAKFVEKYHFMSKRDRTVSTVPMKKIASNSLFDYYEAEMDYDKVIGIGYYFQMEKNNKNYYYGNYKFLNGDPDTVLNMFVMSTIEEDHVYDTPDWAKNAIVYQIFPDRFYRGDISCNHERYDNWDTQVTPTTILGGTLQGIIDKIEYLDDLGINTIYLTPIFSAKSNHKYNIHDYYEIDSQFGTKEHLRILVKKLHEKGIRIIMDAVFNHCSINFFAFKDVVEKGEKSKYKDWFEIYKYPVEANTLDSYKTFGYCSDLPKLKLHNKETEEYFLDVVTYWIKETDIDGWRVDVADEMSHSFWKEARKKIKKIKKDALIVGEIWGDSSAWLNGDQLDTVMNYTFYDAIFRFVAYDDISVEDFNNKLSLIKILYKKQSAEIMWNIIDSHDTSRFLHDAKEDKEKLKLAVLIQLTYVGVPVIYYGDEIGMTGGYDPGCRMGMVWDSEKQDTDLKDYYKKLIKIRKEKKALTEGEIQITRLCDKTRSYGYKRVFGNEEIYIFINNSEAELNIPIEFGMKNLLSDQFVEKMVTLPAKSGIILEKTIKETE